MYVYFDTNGIVKELVNYEYLRVGNDNVNDLYLYFEGDRTISQIVVKIKQNNANETVITHILDLASALKTNIEIPYNENREMKYFKYYTPYNFYKYAFDSTDLEYSGVLEVSVIAYFSNGNTAMGKLVLNVENSLVEVNTSITRAEYEGLLRDVRDMTLSYVPINSILGENVESVYAFAGVFYKKVWNVDAYDVLDFYSHYNRFVYQDSTTKQIINFKRVNQFVVDYITPINPFNSKLKVYEGIDGFGIKYICKFLFDNETQQATCEIAYETPQNDNVPIVITAQSDLTPMFDEGTFIGTYTSSFNGVGELYSRETIYTLINNQYLALNYSKTYEEDFGEDHILHNIFSTTFSVDYNSTIYIYYIEYNFYLVLGDSDTLTQEINYNYTIKRVA